MTAWLGIALRRAAHDAALVLAAALVVLASAGVLVAAAIYPDAIVRAGIARTLAADDAAASGISVAIDVRQADVTTFDGTVRELVAGALGPAAGGIAFSGMSESYGLPTGDPQSAPTTRFAFGDGLDTHARLVRGRWAVDTGAVLTPELEATVSEPAAVALGVDAGSALVVTSRFDPGRRFTVRIVGIFAIDDPADAFWGANDLLLTGSEQRGPFTTVGPIYVGPNALLGRTIVTWASLLWRAAPAFDRLAPADLGWVSGNVSALGDRLAGRLGRGQAIVVTTGLPRLLAGVSDGLTQADSGATLVTGQIVVIAMYALILVAALVVGQRRATTSLLRARGASSRHLIGLALIEAGIVAVPAAALGLPLGLGLAVFLANSGPSLASASATLVPAIVQLSEPVVGLAALAAIVATIGLTVPTAFAVGPLARVHRSPGRQRAAALLQRSRIDLALVGLGAFGLWRLRESADATQRTATPLAVAGPAIGLLAGAILLLRIVPVVGRAIERAFVTGGSVGAALSVRSVARRSTAYGRPALLFAMSAAIGLFAIGYGRTWEGSQRDQAAQAVGADIRGQAGPTPHVTDQAAAAAYSGIPGVTRVTPVVHEDFATGPALQHGLLVAIEPQGMGAVAAFRPDLATRPFADLMASLVAGRPDPPVVDLAAGTRRVRVRVDLSLAAVGSAAHLPTGWAGLSVTLVLRDGGGVLHRVASSPGPGSPDDAFVVPVDSATAVAGRSPGAILAIELGLALPGGQMLSGSVGIRSLETSATTGNDDWTAADSAIPFTSWTLIRSAFGVRPTALPSGPATVPGDLIEGTIATDAALSGPGTVTIVARPAALANLADAPLAGLVDPALLAATGASNGDVVLVRHASSVIRRIRVSDTVTAFPSLASPGFAIVDLGSLQLAQYAADGTFATPDEWWLSVTPGTERSVVAALSVGQAALQGVRSRAAETASRTNDPIALAVSGMLVLAALAAGAFAAIGFAAAAWASTHSRLGEFAVARALGLSRGQVLGWLVLEQAFPALIGVIWGIVLGLALEWLVLPAVTLGPGGAPAVPPALVSAPLDLIAAYLVGAAVLIGGAAAVLSRVVQRAGMINPLRGES